MCTGECVEHDMPSEADMPLADQSSRRYCVHFCIYLYLHTASSCASMPMPKGCAWYTVYTDQCVLYTTVYLLSHVQGCEAHEECLSKLAAEAQQAAQNAERHALLPVTQVHADHSRKETESADDAGLYGSENLSSIASISQDWQRSRTEVAAAKRMYESRGYITRMPDSNDSISLEAAHRLLAGSDDPLSMHVAASPNGEHVSQHHSPCTGADRVAESAAKHFNAASQQGRQSQHATDVAKLSAHARAPFNNPPQALPLSDAAHGTNAGLRPSSEQHEHAVQDACVPATQAWDDGVDCLLAADHTVHGQQSAAELQAQHEPEASADKAASDSPVPSTQLVGDDADHMEADTAGSGGAAAIDARLPADAPVPASIVVPDSINCSYELCTSLLTDTTMGSAGAALPVPPTQAVAATQLLPCDGVGQQSTEAAAQQEDNAAPAVRQNDKQLAGPSPPDAEGNARRLFEVTQCTVRESASPQDGSAAADAPPPGADAVTAGMLWPDSAEQCLGTVCESQDAEDGSAPRASLAATMLPCTGTRSGAQPTLDSADVLERSQPCVHAQEGDNVIHDTADTVNTFDAEPPAGLDAAGPECGRGTQEPDAAEQPPSKSASMAEHPELAVTAAAEQAEAAHVPPSPLNDAGAVPKHSVLPDSQGPAGTVRDSDSDDVAAAGADVAPAVKPAAANAEQHPQAAAASAWTVLETAVSDGGKGKGGDASQMV